MPRNSSILRKIPDNVWFSNYYEVEIGDKEAWLIGGLSPKQPTSDAHSGSHDTHLRS
jgi:hypothetical protein